MEPGFFDQVRDAFEGFVKSLGGELHASTHRYGIKVWYGDDVKEHYEAQAIRVDGSVKLEVGFHAEHPKADQNEAVLKRLKALEATWRTELGNEAEAGAFIGRTGWRRISEVWPEPPADSIDDVIDVAARLADYVIALEPLRTRAHPK